MNTSGLLQSKWSSKGFMLTLQESRSIHDSVNILDFTLTLQETRSIRESMNIPKIEFITYIYILYHQSSINFQFSPNLAGFPDILN